jgi:ELWxxDGT repeat protein
MKKGLQLLGLLLTCFSSFAQVKINSNRSLEFEGALGNNKALYVSAIDKTLWVSDGTAVGTFQLSSTIKYEDAGGVLDNKLIFSGTTPGTGTELFITDGTVAGTTLVKDIMPGTEGSLPDDDFALLNGYLYFTAVSPGIGRELWRTNGTLNGTTLVKDIIEGPAQSSMPGNYDIFSTGNYLLLRIPTTAEGLELWKSDGTAGGTVLLKDINPGSASSQPGNFYLYNNMVLFTATHAQYGKEIWRTDGTEQGTQLVKDIREGSSGSVGFILFYQFNGRAYFQQITVLQETRFGVLTALPITQGF